MSMSYVYYSRYVLRSYDYETYMPPATLLAAPTAAATATAS